MAKRMSKRTLDHDKENNPPKAKKKVSLSLKKKPDSRFAHVTSDDMCSFSAGYVPPNTEKCTKWSLKVFGDWIASRKGSDDECPVDLLVKQTPEELNNWLSRFVVEVRRNDGCPYPPRTIHQILSGILRHMRSINPMCPNILDRKDGRFRKISGSCEVVFRQLRQAGVGASIKHTATITMEEEQRLWESGVMNVEEPFGLFRAIFYYVGKVCCLRGGEEQRSLKISQFSRSYEPDAYTYTETGSKNRSGSAAQLNLENKIVKIHSTPENHPRCVVFLMDLYLSKLPSYAFENDIFYLKPKRKKPVSSEESWYECVAVGKNKLATVVKDMFAEVGVEGKTNHSLRATGATTLFDAGVPEKIIQKTTGHRSTEALRRYERVSEQQEKAVANILTTNETMQFTTNQSSEASSVSTAMGGFHGCTISNVVINLQKKD